MDAPRSRTSVLMEDLSESAGASSEHLQAPGVLLEEDVFQRYLRSLKALLNQHQVPASKVFISYSLEAEASPERPLLESFLKRLSQDLQTLGISVVLGLEQAAEQRESRTRDAIADSDCFIVIGTPCYKRSLTEPHNPTALEYGLLMESVHQSTTTQRGKRCLPLLYSGSFEDAFPEGLSQDYCDCRESPYYYRSFMDVSASTSLMAYLYPMLLTDVALQTQVRALVAAIEQPVDATRAPRSHTQSRPAFTSLGMEWDEESPPQRSRSFIAKVRRASTSSRRADNHVPLLERSDDPLLVLLDKLGIDRGTLSERGIARRYLDVILKQELSYRTHLRWAAVDNLLEKILQGLLLGREDVNPSALVTSNGFLKYLKMSARQMPQGRSLFLKLDFGLKKMHAARGFVRTVDVLLVETINLFIAAALSYRAYEWMRTGHSDFSEFRETFEANSRRGVTSLMHVLSGMSETGLWFLLFSPLMAGAFKGLWDTRRSQIVSEAALAQLQQRVEAHVRPLEGFGQKAFAYLWLDTLRQKLSLPFSSSLSEGIQKAERALRWDGRLRAHPETCQQLFETIERVALKGRGLSQMAAMESLAKLVHSLSMRDFARLQEAGYPPGVFVDILAMKTRSLELLHQLAGKRSTEEASDSQMSASRQLSLNPAVWSTTLYAHYLLWWLGMNDTKATAAFWAGKLLKLALQGLFLKTIIESVLELIRCPDKKGFRMFYGDYEIWANQLTADCFKEFVRRFRLVSKSEAIEPFLEQLQHFDLRTLDSLNLSVKDLTAEEIKAILEILHEKEVKLKILNLAANRRIRSETADLVFPATLTELNLAENTIDDAGVIRLQLPEGLRSLNLNFNQISAAGVRGLRLPSGLKTLTFGNNKIGPEGAIELQLPPGLTSLMLNSNEIGAVGARGLRLPPGLETLFLGSNKIGPEGAIGLQWPVRLTSLNLEGNEIGDVGAVGLQLPAGLKTLNLDGNGIGDAGAIGLKLPTGLTSLSLTMNKIGAAGAMGLRQHPGLTSLDLRVNTIGSECVIGLQWPVGLTSLKLDSNKIDDACAMGLQLPLGLTTLSLANNKIGDAGAIGLKLPAGLKILDLGYNEIGVAGAIGLELPEGLAVLALVKNKVGDAGAMGLRLPAGLKNLDLQANSIGIMGFRLQLPAGLTGLYLGLNEITDADISGLQLPAGLRTLGLQGNKMGAAGVAGLRLPPGLLYLYLGVNKIGDEGAIKLRLPPGLKTLDLSESEIGDFGAIGLQLPAGLQTLHLDKNKIRDKGALALLEKISASNIININLDHNLYNETLINLRAVVEQKQLIELCQDQLCHANLPLKPSKDVPRDESNKVSAGLFFSWNQKPFAAIKTSVSSGATSLINSLDQYLTASLDGFGLYLREILSDCPSYFHNIDSPDVRDWPSAGTATLWQFNGADIGSPSPLPMVSATIPLRLGP